jgi:hypothetical protein
MTLWAVCFDSDHTNPAPRSTAFGMFDASTGNAVHCIGGAASCAPATPTPAHISNAPQAAPATSNTHPRMDTPSAHGSRLGTERHPPPRMTAGNTMP